MLNESLSQSFSSMWHLPGSCGTTVQTPPGSPAAAPTGSPPHLPLACSPGPPGGSPPW